MAKRKREASPPLRAQASLPQSSPPAGEAQRTHKRQRGGDEPKIVYELADGSRRLERRLGRDKTLVDALYKVTKKLRITTPGSVRLSQVRQGGREVEIYDEFDYKALKERARAGKDGHIVVTVYPGSRPGETPSSPISPFSTPTSHAGPSSRPVSPSTPRSILSTSSRSGPSTPTAHNKQKAKKRVSILEPPSTARNTPQAASAKPTTPKHGKGKGKPVDPMVSTAPAVATNNINVPEGVVITPNVLRLLNKYKPSQPSPLSKPTRMDSDTSDSESPVKSATDQNNPTPPRKRVRQRRKRNSLPSTEEDHTGASSAEDTVAAGSASVENAAPRDPPGTPTAERLQESTSASDIPPVPTSALSTAESAEPQSSAPRSSSSDPVASQPSKEAQPSSESTAAATPKGKRKPKHSQAVSTDVAEPSSASPSSTPPTDALSPPVPPVDTPAVNSTTVAATQASSATPPPPRSKVVISMASPWNLFDKPADPLQTGDHSSSSIDSPKKGKKSKKNKRETLAAGGLPRESDAAAPGVPPTVEDSARQGADAEPPVPEPATAPSLEANIAGKDQSSLNANLNPASTPRSSAQTLSVNTPSTPAPAAPATSVAESSTTTPVTAKKAKKAARVPSSSIAKDIMAAYRAKQAADLAKEQAAAASVESTPAPVEPAVVPSPDPAVADALGTTDAPLTDVDATVPANGDETAAAQARSAQPQAPVEEEQVGQAASDPVPGAEPPTSVEQATVEDPPAGVNTVTAPGDVNDSPASHNAPNGAPAVEPATEGSTPAPEEAVSHTPDESSPINAKTKVARPLTLWSQHIEGMTRGGREENAILASRAACIICGSAADHLQKDCPEVKKGRESLEALLQVRREEAQAEKEELARRAALRKTKKGRKALEDGDDLGTAAESAETIEKWVERLKRLDAVKDRVVNGRQDGSPKVNPCPIWGQPPSQSTAQSTENHSSPSNRATTPADEPEVDVVTSTAQTPGRPAAEVHSVESPSLPAASETNADRPSIKVVDMADPLAHSNGEEIPVPLLQTPTEEEAMSSFPLHQLALQRMNKKKRPGSLSGLSASDAVIETGDSDTDSSDSDSMSMTRSPIGSILGRMDETDSGSDSDSVDSEDEGGPGAASDSLDAHEAEQEDGEDGDNEESGPSSRSPSVSDSGSESGSSGSGSNSSSSSRSSSPSSDSMADDPEASFRRFLSQPLSAKEKKRARLSAASATPSQTLDLEMEIDEPPYIDDIEEDEEPPVPSQVRGRRGSDSSIDVGHADEDEEKMDVDDEILPASLTQPPTLTQSDIETDDTASEGGPAEPQRTSRSFVDLAREAGPSPTVDDLEGAIALQEAIAEEEMPQVLVEETVEDKRPRPVVSRGLPSPPSSQEEDIVATQLRDEGTPRSLGGRAGGGRVPSSLPMESSQGSQPAHSQSCLPDAASQPSRPVQTLRRSTRGSTSTPTSPVQAARPVANGQAGSQGMRRRLRSASRELPDVVPPPRLTRRTAAASQEPTSPAAPSSSMPNGTARGRRQASMTASPEMNRRVTRSRSQITPDRPSVNTAPPSSAANGLQLELIEEQETPKAVKIGVANATPISQLDERESSAAIPEDTGSDSGTEANTPTAPGHAALTQRSPLFMSQGSQPLATQRYTLVDSSLPSEPLDRHSSRTDLRPTSPIMEENEDDDAEDVDDAASRQSSSDEDNDIPLIRPIQPIRRTASQGPPALAMPTLSSLDTSLLRARSTRAANRTGTSASQPTPKTSKMGMGMGVAESESEVSSSSDEDEVPPERKGRYATGRKTRGKAKTNGVMRGW